MQLVTKQVRSSFGLITVAWSCSRTGLLLSSLFYDPFYSLMLPYRLAKFKLLIPGKLAWCRPTPLSFSTPPCLNFKRGGWNVSLKLFLCSIHKKSLNLSLRMKCLDDLHLAAMSALKHHMWCFIDISNDVLVPASTGKVTHFCVRETALCHICVWAVEFIRSWKEEV